MGAVQGHRTYGCAAGEGRRDDTVFTKCPSCLVPSPLSAPLPCHYLGVVPSFFPPRCLSELNSAAPPALPRAAAMLSRGNGQLVRTGNPQRC